MAAVLAWLACAAACFGSVVVLRLAHWLLSLAGCWLLEVIDPK